MNEKHDNLKVSLNRLSNDRPLKMDKAVACSDGLFHRRLDALFFRDKLRGVELFLFLTILTSIECDLQWQKLRGQERAPTGGSNKSNCRKLILFYWLLYEQRHDCRLLCRIFYMPWSNLVGFLPHAVHRQEYLQAFSFLLANAKEYHGEAQPRS